MTLPIKQSLFIGTEYQFHGVIVFVKIIRSNRVYGNFL